MVNGWIEKSLGDLFDFSGGLSASRNDLSMKGYPYLHYGDIHGSTRTFVDVCADGYIPRLDIDLNKVSNASLLNDGDVVFVDASEDDEGASRHIVIRNTDDLPFISGLHTIIAKAKTDELDNKFKEYCFQTALIKSQFKYYAVGTKVTGVSKTTIGKIILSYPQDKFEQHRIAKVLSDTDELIATLEKLITKKRAIKQGAMQELLTGKKRLHGFNGEWVEKKLGDFGNCIRGVSYNPSIDLFSYENRNAFVLLRANNIINDRIAFNNVLYVNKSVVSTEQKLLLGDIVIAMSSGSVIAIGKNGYYTGFSQSCCVGAFCAIFRSEFNNYINFLFQSTMYRERLSTVLEGTSINNLNSRIIEGLTFLFPQEKAEQTAIASILSDMDAEIDALTAKLNKLRNIKQGMMSELLTGRIRLTMESSPK